MAGDQEFSVLLVSDDTFLREGARRFFEQSQYKIVEEVHSIAAALENKRDSVNLILVGGALQEKVLELLRGLRSAYPESRIVVYAQSVQVASTTLIHVFGTSLDGCLLCDSSLEVIRQSLDLVMMGGNVFPFSLLSAALPREGGISSKATTSEDRLFSDREHQVLAFLRDGRSNKFIAREMGLAEATVKFHMKTVLRKIGCANRTQAAIWVTKYEKAAKAAVQVEEQLRVDAPASA